MRRSVAIVVIVLAACGSDPTPVEAFCDEAVPVLKREDLGYEPEALHSQMEELAEIAEPLPTDEEERLMVFIDDLIGELRLAEQGQVDDDGWSSFEVVDYVQTLCDRDDLTWWVVIP